MQNLTCGKLDKMETSLWNLKYLDLHGGLAIELLQLYRVLENTLPIAQYILLLLHDLDSLVYHSKDKKQPGDDLSSLQSTIHFANHFGSAYPQKKIRKKKRNLQFIIR